MAFHFQTLYQVNNGDDLGSGTYWNQRFQDIDLRLNAVEAYASTINASADSVTTQALDRVNNIVNPYITSLEDQINSLSSQVSSLQSSVVTDQDNVNNQLAALLAQGQTLVNNLSSLGDLSDGTF